MNKDKLNDAILTHISELEEIYFFNSEFATIVMNVWDKVTDCLMQQPLSERLTEAEIAKAKAAYNRAEECYNNDADDMSYASGLVVKTVLKEIFGADLFEEK